MRLTQFSNFAIRVLMYAALKGNVPSAVPEIARAYGVSYDHLKKAAAELCRRGYLETVRGRNGGVRLAKDPGEIRDRRGSPADGRGRDPGRMLRSDNEYLPFDRHVPTAGRFARSAGGFLRRA